MLYYKILNKYRRDCLDQNDHILQKPKVAPFKIKSFPYGRLEVSLRFQSLTDLTGPISVLYEQR